MKTQIRQIIPYLWYDRNAEEAAHFYVSLFPNSRITGVLHAPTETPSGNEIGGVLMPLQEYPFSQRFGWVVDRYGLSWQIDLGGRPQKVTPALMFTGAQDGRAEAAINAYTSLFANSGIERIERYGDADEGRAPGTVKVAVFHLNGQEFMAMDGGPGHAFTFNEAFSLMATCDTQEDIDRLWEAMSADPEAEQCGWLKDEFGVSWQIVPVEMMDMLSSSDPERARRVMEAFMPMKKLDLETLRLAYHGERA